MNGRWSNPADGVWVAKQHALALNLTVIVGTRRALLVDSGFGDHQFARALRRRTALPVDVVYTHAHFDHVYGTSFFPEARVYAHPACANTLAGYARSTKDRWIQFMRDEGCEREASMLRTAVLVQPTSVLTDETVDLGERAVRIFHPGRGHTEGDLVVMVPDSQLLVAGDLVEQGAPPSADDDAFPALWPSTMDVLLGCDPRIVIPGHGDPVDAQFVARQRDELHERFRLHR